MIIDIDACNIKVLLHLKQKYIESNDHFILCVWLIIDLCDKFKKHQWQMYKLQWQIKNEQWQISETICQIKPLFMTNYKLQIFHM